MKNAQKTSILEMLDSSSEPISTGRLYKALLDSGEEIERPTLFEFLKRVKKKRIVKQHWNIEDGTIVFTWQLLTSLVGNLNEL